MSDLQTHWFGLPVPDGLTPVRSWGARAIFRVNVTRVPVHRKGRLVGSDVKQEALVEMIPDRSQYRGPDRDESPAAKVFHGAFFQWIESVALPWLREEVNLQAIRPDDRLELRLDQGAYHLRADPRGSFGYLYIVVWEE